MFFKKKISYIFSINILFCYLLIFTHLFSSELDTPNENFCETIDPINFIEQNSPDQIVIETNNARRWETNLFTLYLDLNAEKYKTHNKDWYTFQIKDKFKKKFKSNIKFVYKDPDYECISKGRISVRGNLWWHLDWTNGVPFSSLRVDFRIYLARRWFIAFV